MPELIIATAAGSILLQTNLRSREKFTIGRSERCDVRLTGANVARFHAVLYEESGVWYMLDTTISADRGVWVADERRTLVRMQPDEPVRIGDVFFWFMDDAPAEPLRDLPTVRLPEDSRVMSRERYVEYLWQIGTLNASQRPSVEAGH